MKAIYPEDRDPAADAEPGVSAQFQVDADAPFVTLEVDGEVFAIGPDNQGGSAYTWLSGPNPAYGFALSPTQDSLDEHRENIREFLVDIDPTSGYLGED